MRYVLIIMALTVGAIAQVRSAIVAPGATLPQVVSAYQANTTQPASAANASQSTIWDGTLPAQISQTANKSQLVPVVTTSTLDQMSTHCGGSLSDTSYPSGNLIIDWNSASPGFAVSGYLSRVRFFPTANANTGATINVWVVRPTTLNSAIGTSQPYSFTVIAQVGTIDGSAANVYQEIAGLSIPVNAGDMIAFQPVGRGMVLYAGSGPCNAFFELYLTLGGTAIGGLIPGMAISGNAIAGGREYLFSADIIPTAAFSSDSVPGGVLRLDSYGDIPVGIGRSADMPWLGKKIIWVGTSIPAQTSGTPSTTYPQIVGVGLQANLDNESMGSSGIVWNGTRCLSLMATPAQLTAATGCSGYTSQSYQNRVMGKSADMLVIDHGHNDTAPNALGTISDNATGTAYSASGGTLTITAANNFTNGETVLMIAGSTDALLPLNGQTFTVLSGGLSSTQYEITTGAVTGSGTTKAVAANTSTFYGAEQALIAAAYTDNPSIRIVLVTPPKNIDRGYTPALDMTASGIRPAIFAIAALWQLPVVDLAANDGFNDTNYCVGGALPCTIYTPDGTHPAPFARSILARILYQAINGL